MSIDENRAAKSQAKFTGRVPHPDDLVMRERTQNIRLETTYCRMCGYNHYRNIGELTCVKCGLDK